VRFQQACDTGIEAAVYIGNKIALGQIESGIACGVEAMSNIPFESSPD
jgi:acetyl-CoA C-acetyltransferase